MPSKKAYDLVTDDGYDGRIPLHNDEAFQHGLQFQAKYIGTLDVPRPSSRVEIVAAMRRIRYEFKAKSIKKKKIVLTVSVDGVKVTLRKKKKSQWSLEETRQVIMAHPIYRIFYVSHDSQDLKIWSYIARDGPNNVFKCNVFKAYKKSQAMRIVRTIGQAFEVCHKLGGQTRPTSDLKEDKSDRSSDDNERRANNAEDKRTTEKKEINTGSDETGKEKGGKISPPNDLSLKQTQQSLQTAARKQSSTLASPVLLGEGSDPNSDNNNLPLSHHHQVQLLRQQLEQQQHHTQVAIAQVHLLKDQLSAEAAARIESQARAHQLLLHNKDLLDHVALLVTRVHSLEVKVGGGHSQNIETFRVTSQVPVLPDAITPRPAPVYLPDASHAKHFIDRDVMGGASTFANSKAGLDADSPDSGHKEMSSESLSFSLANDGAGWFNPYGPSSMTSSQDSSRLDNELNGRSSSPHSSSPSKSSTLKADSTGSLDHHNASVTASANTSSSSISTISNNSNKDYQHNRLRDSYGKSPNLYKSSSEKSPNRKEASNGVKVISHVTSNSDYAINKAINSNAPKIEPPPKFRRAPRSVERWERGSWYGMPVAENSAHGFIDRDHSHSRIDHAHSAVVLRNHNRSNSNASSISSNSGYGFLGPGQFQSYKGPHQTQNGFGVFRYSDCSSRSSVHSDANFDNIMSVSHNEKDESSSTMSYSNQPDRDTSSRQKNNRVNDLNSKSHKSPVHQSGGWRMRLSYTSDENSDTSCDTTSNTHARNHCTFNGDSKDNQRKGKENFR